ncbi:MAG: tRNA uridine-5-carboxymethylaminomethyl(34) synthesis GTPase MnmE [Deltaproteobacteria bacterium]|jgi:tRNA modification GTPase|nr:tRNA uridine-5-carboxymethylaminomethyl(34) synthesis GTPase MnmE [Deltaproteobacteria bacterium]
MPNNGDLIAAVSTAPGPGALAVVRLSGAGTLNTLARVFRSKKSLEENPRTLIRGRVVDPRDGGTADHALAVWFPGPSSFTGEDSAEIQGHGGSLIPGLVLRLLLDEGARLARPGEFTERAFLNGKLSLDQAEAVAEIVAAESAAEAKIAARTLDGALKEKVSAIFLAMKGAYARLTAVLDFEEEWTPKDADDLLNALKEARESLKSLIDLRKRGRFYRDGLKVVLAGAPNAGKSELFNALLGKKRALVSPVPGTTRDYLTAAVSWGNVRVELVDTAGLREEGGDELEKMGQALALEQMGEADLVLRLRDLTNPERIPTPEAEKGIPGLEVWNKTDLVSTDRGPLPPGLKISAKTGDGLEELKEAALKLLGIQGARIPDIVPNLRQEKAIEESHRLLEEAVASLSSGEPPEICGVLLRRSLDRLGEVTGRVFTEDLLTEVFKRFCLGK